MVFMDEIGQAFDIDVEFVDDGRVEIAIEGHEYLIELGPDLQQHTAYNLSIPSSLEVN